jgi:hypothetical protein
MMTKTLIVLAAAALLGMACSSTSGAQGGDAGGAGGRAGTSGAVGVGGGGGGGVGSGTGGVGALDGGNDVGGTTCGPNSDDASIVPSNLEVSLELGGAGVLDLYALTLREGSDGLDLYAALRNDGEVPACDAALKVQLLDTTGQPLGQWIGGLYTKDFYLYTLTDAGATTIAACVSPGDVTMTKISITADIALADVGQVIYYYTYFALDAVPIDGLRVSEVDTVATAQGTSYAGTIVNELSMPVAAPSVAVFALNCAGRPLGLAIGGDTSDVPAGGSWTFQTSSVDTAGVGYAAFPAAAF